MEEKKTKGRVIEIPLDFNRKLKKRVLELEEIGVETSVPELIIKYAEIGFLKEKLLRIESERGADLLG